MPRIVIAGGGFVGLSTALMLAQRGMDVVVLERDVGPTPGSPEDAWLAWERRGVAQFKQAHFLHPAGSRILGSQLPDVKQGLLDAHAASFDLLALLPPFIDDREPREGDERFTTLTARRPVVEYVVARRAEQRVDVRRGVKITGLVAGTPAASGTPHVTGVRTSSGEELTADLVIDAMGRRSELPDWLAALGARPPAEEAEDSGFSYYTRYFRSPAGTMPAFLTGLLTPFDCYSLLTLPGDSGTWSVTIYISSHDQALKGLRHQDTWTATIAACPLHAHLLDGDPISGVIPISGIVDRHRRCVVDGTPVLTGLVTVGDSTCCTNPSLGRGMTMGLMHAVGTVQVISDHLDDPLALAIAHDQMTQARITPWYRDTVGFDRGRKAQIDAAVDGRPSPAPAGPAAPLAAALPRAMLYDPDIFRAYLETVSMVTLPAEVMARPGLSERIQAIAGQRDDFVMPGPDRAGLLKLLA
jgi:2-polyprenyl-6-methoxyphenol hydroxylase-like FAD-dependent oxidoreductase